MRGPWDRPKYLHRNDSTWTPPHVIFLDSETRTDGQGPTEAEVLRLWAAKMVYRRDRRRAGEVAWAEGTTGAQAAEAVNAWASYGTSVWLYAHNTGFDLTVTGLPVHLARLGWELSSLHGIGGGASWMVLHKGRREYARKPGDSGHRADSVKVSWDHTLTITDSVSLLPRGLDYLSTWTTAAKPPLPAQDAPETDWMARCKADVNILAEAVLTVMDWWDDRQLGRWQVTGPATGWNAYRHTITTGDLDMAQTDRARAFARDACYGGRREAYRVGDLPQGRYAEIDFTAAYPTIAAELPLPWRCLTNLTRDLLDRIASGDCDYGAIAKVTIVTDTPAWPCRIGGRVFYPVGRFTTILAGPDLVDAVKAGVIAQLHHGYVYCMSRHMQRWARWVLGVLNSAEGDEPGLAKIAAKAWSRTVIGKTAQRGWRSWMVPGPPSDSWTHEECFIAGSTDTVTMTGLAGRYFLSVADAEGAHEFPAILAYVEAHVRQRLNLVLARAPAGAVLQCDTDGVMVDYTALERVFPAQDHTRENRTLRDNPGAAVVDYWSLISAPLVMREKAAYRKVTIYGPQHVTLDGQPRFAGVPSSAEETSPGRWSAQLWPGLAWQIANSGNGSYTRPVQEYDITGPYTASWVLADGTVRPVETTTRPDLSNEVRPWSETRWAASGGRLAPRQPDWAGGLFDADT